MDDLISRQQAIDAINEIIRMEHSLRPKVYVAKDAIKQLPSVQLEIKQQAINSSDYIDRRAALDALDKRFDSIPLEQTSEILLLRKDLRELPSAQPEIVRCKDCKYWNSGSCECREHAVNCQDYMVGDIETEAEHFCGYAKKREVTT